MWKYRKTWCLSFVFFKVSSYFFDAEWFAVSGCTRELQLFRHFPSSQHFRSQSKNDNNFTIKMTEWVMSSLVRLRLIYLDFNYIFTGMQQAAAAAAAEYLCHLASITAANALEWFYYWKIQFYCFIASEHRTCCVLFILFHVSANGRRTGYHVTKCICMSMIWPVYACQQTRMPTLHVICCFAQTSLYQICVSRRLSVFCAVGGFSVAPTNWYYR